MQMKGSSKQPGKHRDEEQEEESSGKRKATGSGDSRGASGASGASGANGASGASKETQVETVIRLDAIEVRDLFPEISREDPQSRVCVLCAMRLKDKTHNLNRHLERHHMEALVQLVDQRNRASPMRLAKRAKTASSSTQGRVTPKRAPPTTGAVHQVEASSKASNRMEKSPKKLLDKEEISLRVESAKQFLMKWLATEQIPVELLENREFREFVNALNSQMQEFQQGVLFESIAASVKQEANWNNGVVKKPAAHPPNASEPTVAKAIVARSRHDEEPSRAEITHLAVSSVVGRGEARVRVVKCLASRFDALACQGRIKGKNGVLGQQFVGMVETVASECSVEMCSKWLNRRVVASLYLPCDPCLQSRSSPTCQHLLTLGRSSTKGSLIEHMVLPLSNLFVVPDAIPDPMALLAPDFATILDITRVLLERSRRSIAIVSGEEAFGFVDLLTNHLTSHGGFATDHITVFAQKRESEDGDRFTSANGQNDVLHQIGGISVHYKAAPTDLHAFEAVIDVCGSEQSMDFAQELVQPLSTIILADRGRFHMEPNRMLDINMNSVVVNELEVVCLQGTDLSDALAFLEDRVEATPSLDLKDLFSVCPKEVDFDSALELLARNLPSESSATSSLLQVVVSCTSRKK